MVYNTEYISVTILVFRILWVLYKLFSKENSSWKEKRLHRLKFFFQVNECLKFEGYYYHQIVHICRATFKKETPLDFKRY